MRQYLDQLPAEAVDKAIAGFQSLTACERRILAYLVNGVDDAQIAQLIDKPVSDVESWRLSIQTKVGIDAPIQLAMTAIALLPRWI